MGWRIGVDIGGTFTDVAIVDDESGRIGVAKTLTTPRDFAGGVLAALDTAIERYGIRAADVALLTHATTVVTNALLEEKGARAVMIATAGFRDILELRRSSRPDLYDLFQDAPGDAGAAASPTSRSPSASAPTAKSSSRWRMRTSSG